MSVGLNDIAEESGDDSRTRHNGEFHVRGTYDDGKPGWGIKVWLKGSDQDGPEDHEYR
jgi:hypothetical protein